MVHTNCIVSCMFYAMTTGLLLTVTSGGVIQSARVSTALQQYPPDEDCRIPDDLADRFREFQANQPHDFLYAVPTLTDEGYVQSPEKEERYSIRFNETLEKHMYGDRDLNCSHVYGSIQDRCGLPVEQASMCQWTYYVDHDPHRFPKDILQAQCSRCVKCDCRVHPDLGLCCFKRCEYVRAKVTVFRRTGCVLGLWQYVPSVELISVGCTCQHSSASVVCDL